MKILNNTKAMCMAVTMLLSIGQLNAQEITSASSKGEAIITHSRMIGIGATNVLDTYLGPTNYTGSDFRFIDHTLRKRENSRRIIEMLHQGNFSYLNNESQNGREIGGNYVFQYGIHYRLKSWNIGQNILHLDAGANAQALLGFLYNTRNSNNPAQAYASLSINPTAAVTYFFKNPFKKNSTYRDFALCYEIGVPLIGLRFSPNYGQSYYEIFSLGNYDHNVVMTHPGNNPSLRHQFSIDFPLLHTTFRIGYLGDFQQSSVNHLKQHQYTHAVLLGITKTFKITKVKQ